MSNINIGTLIVYQQYALTFQGCCTFFMSVMAATSPARNNKCNKRLCVSFLGFSTAKNDAETTLSDAICFGDDAVSYMFNAR